MTENLPQRPWFRVSNISATHNLIALFCHLVDERRFDEIEALVTPDISYENAMTTVSGWPAIRRGLDALKCFRATQHLIGNHLGSWDHDRFFGKTYCIASHLYSDDGEERRYEMGICYEEHIVVVDGALKLARRKLNLLWSQDLPTTRQTPEIFRAAMANLMPGDKKS